MNLAGEFIWAYPCLRKSLRKKMRSCKSTSQTETLRYHKLTWCTLVQGTIYLKSLEKEEPKRGKTMSISVTSALENMPQPNYWRIIRKSHTLPSSILISRTCRKRSLGAVNFLLQAQTTRTFIQFIYFELLILFSFMIYSIIYAPFRVVHIHSLILWYLQIYHLSKYGDIALQVSPSE